MAGECEKHSDFVRVCGNLEAKMEMVVEGQNDLFDLVRDLGKTSAQYQVHIENLNKLYGNGWKAHIENQITTTLAEIADRDKKRDEKITALETVAWVGRFFTDFRDKWFRRTLQIGFGLVLLGIFDNLASVTGRKVLSGLAKTFGW